MQPPEMFYKKVFFEILQNLQQNTCVRVSFLTRLQALDCSFNKKRHGTGAFCKFWEISKNIFFTEHLRKIASVNAQ